MMYSEKELDDLQDILESEKVCKLMESLDNVMVDYESLPNVSDMVDDAICGYKKNYMRVCKAIFEKEGEERRTGYAIETEDYKDVGYTLYKQYESKNGQVPEEILHTLMELTYYGYQLKPTKELKTLVIDLN